MNWKSGIGYRDVGFLGNLEQGNGVYGKLLVNNIMKK